MACSTFSTSQTSSHQHRHQCNAKTLYCQPDLQTKKAWEACPGPGITFLGRKLLRGSSRVSGP